MTAKKLAKVPRGRPAEYPWAKWTDGRIYRVRRKKHFWCRVDSFMAGLRKRAAVLGVKVTADSHGDEVKFQFCK